MAFGDVIQEGVAASDNFGGQPTIAVTLPGATAGSLMNGRYSNDRPLAGGFIINSPGYVVDVAIENGVQADLGIIVSKVSAGGDETLSITATPSVQAVLRFKEIEGPFADPPIDQIATAPRTQTTFQSTGTTPATVQAAEFAAALIIQSTQTAAPGLAVSNGFIREAQDTTIGTKSIFHADKVLAATEPVETTFSNLPSVPHVGCVATYLKAPPPPPPNMIVRACVALWQTVFRSQLKVPEEEEES